MQHRARTAQRHPASKFRPRQSKNVPQIPQQRHLRIAIKRACCAIYLEMNHKARPFDSRAKGILRLFYAEAMKSCTRLRPAGRCPVVEKFKAADASLGRAQRTLQPFSATSAVKKRTN